MRAKSLRRALLSLIAGCGLGVGFAPAADSGAEPEPQAAGSDVVPEPEAAAAEPGKARQRAKVTADQWWAHAREVLLEGLELSEEQTRQIDAVIASQLDALERARKLKSELQVAQEQDDPDRGAALRARLRANREQIKRPPERFEEIRTFLREEQRPSFDMNRARLSAESQQPRKKRRRKRSGASAEGKVE